MVPYYNIGMVLQSRGNIEAALVYYEKYLSLEQNPPASVRILVEKLQKKSVR